MHEAAAIFRADDAQSIDNFSSYLKSATPMHSCVYVDTPPTHTRRGPQATSKSILKYLSPPVKARSDYDVIIDSLSKKRRPLTPELARLRAIKSLAEQRVMRTAADISGRAHAKVGTLTAITKIAHKHLRQCALRAPESLRPLLRLILSISARCLVRSGQLMSLL